MNRQLSVSPCNPVSWPKKEKQEIKKAKKHFVMFQAKMEWKMETAKDIIWEGSALFLEQKQ